MKRLSLLLVLFTIFNCADEPLEPEQRNCIQTTAVLAEATTNFNAVTPDNYIELCNAYRIALQNQKEFCGDGSGNIQTLLDGLGDCTGTTLPPDDCTSAQAASSSAATVYLNSPSTERCNAYKSTLENQIIVCGDEDGSIQITIDGLGDCNDVGTSNGFAMSFKLDGSQYNQNNPSGNNEASSSTISSSYPSTEYILLQSRNGLFGDVEIDLWIKRDDLVANTTYDVNEGTDGVTTHIDLIDLRSTEFEYTISGTVTIDFVDSINKIVKGTFEFNSGINPWSTDSSNMVTEGIFNYVYDVD